MRFTRLLIVVCILFCFIGACETTDCITFSTNNVIIQYFDKETGNEVDVEFQLIGSPDSEYLFYADTTLNIFYLPIDTEVETTTYLFLDIDNSVDTLIIGYDKRERLIAEYCGFEMQFNNLEVLYTSYDSSGIAVDNLSRLNEENIKIYR